MPEKRERKSQKLDTEDSSDTWTFAMASDGAEARLILDVVAELIRQTDGKRNTLSVDEAKMVLKVRQTAPRLHPWVALQTALEYQRRYQNELDTLDLDMLLAGTGGDVQSDELVALIRLDLQLALQRLVAGTSLMTKERTMDEAKSLSEAFDDKRRGERYIFLRSHGLVDEAPDALIDGMHVTPAEAQSRMEDLLGAPEGERMIAVVGRAMGTPAEDRVFAGMAKVLGGA
jgi:hypothetical protein